MSIPAGITLAGNREPIEGFMSSSISRNNGSSFRRTWQGLYGECEAKANAILATNGWTEVSLEPSGGPLGRLTATYNYPQNGGGEVPIETLDLDFQEINGSIFKNPYFAILNGDDIKKIERVVATARDSSKSDADVTAKITSEGIAAITPIPKGSEALALKMMQIDEYTWEVPSLTYTRTVSPQFPVPMAISDVGFIWSSNDVAEYLEAKAVLFSIPQVSNNIGRLTGFTLGWKKSARFQFISNGNCAMVEKFIYGGWSNLLYQFR